MSLTRGPIINGEPSGAEDDFTVAVGIFQGGQLYGACTGVLIAPNLVLTARHCVSNIEDSGLACGSDGTPIQGGGVGDDYDPADLGILVGSTISQDLSAHGQQIFHPDVDNLCNNDIAAILLDTAITDAPIAQLRLATPPVEGELMEAIGWGVANDSSSYERRHRTDIPIVAVGPFDGSFTEMPVGPNEFLIGEGICEGDSGGPAIDMTTRAVLGVVSRGGNGQAQDPNDPSASCTGDQAQNVYTRVDGFKDWLRTVFDAAGTDPWEEGGPDPRKTKFGLPCASNDECRSNLCLVTKSDGSFCSQSCDLKDATTCPDGYTCQKKADGPVCAPPASASGGCSAAPGAPTETTGLAWLLALGLLGVALVSVRRVRR